MASREGNGDGTTDSKNSVWILDQKLDQQIDVEAERLQNMNKGKKMSILLLLQLSFQSLGVVYGDLGTSPLYVFYNTFPHGIEDTEDVVGALSLIIYSLTIITLLKYVVIVCRANDNGQGGTFALYSLLCRHADIRTISNHDWADEELTTYQRSSFHDKSFAAKTKRWLEGHLIKKTAILVLVLVGSCMVKGDGILTPAISVGVEGQESTEPSTINANLVEVKKMERDFLCHLFNHSDTCLTIQHDECFWRRLVATKYFTWLRWMDFSSC
ncbi:Potassium transporter [Quillaja saponaria]|uniref:Potassium transporter n=1 Tax=Quillaja saponaria TaxID=32244 RepID=A0AAD7KN67_QUISA|nr:Potassium transporter [Quillaja saponaria]